MITLTINEKDGQKFTVRFQVKTMDGDEQVWRDSEVNSELGKSQAYGIDENFRLIVEASETEPPANAGN
ncbi:hypothetical protein I3J27_38755 [Bradyrhizobium xenonodulans]|uniref:Uncharacterized protein n=1 Tax=Bradyrhizobium xenonodulans TaxID=2736875 RepID=A0ABY7MPE7_9BRAD|nr:hypothetical protein [Bradyrhizobium xenonodulans]WBL78805.1 hypothetical protein I3J27_38755 [Bradyrhizobium xenonodulans]